MNNSKLARLIAFACMTVLFLAACGQLPGAHNQAAGGSLVGGQGGQGTTGGTTGTGTTGTGTATGGTAGTGGTSGTGGTGGSGPGVVAGPGDRTGITASEIIIGLHAPLTGAAPIEPAAFEKGKDLYWNWLHKTKKQKVFGRTVRVVFRNDEYQPTTAVAVCNQMATSDRAFLLIGGAGTDQINACAAFADPRGIPYLSPGVQESGLSNRRTYFAVTMTYADQMPMLVQLLKKENSGNKLGTKYGDAKLKIGHVRPNTSNFNDASNALKDAAIKAGYQFKAYTVVKEGNSGEAATVAAQMEQDGVDVVVPITAPTFTTQLVINTGKNGYAPQYAGVGISNNINQMISTACRSNTDFDGALWFSPWAGWKQVMAGKYDKDFADAAQTYAPSVNKRGKGGDLLLALWGIMKTAHQAMVKTGPTMSRQSFIQTMQKLNYSTSVFPDLRFSPGNPFGAKNVHLLLGKCDEPGDGKYVERGAQYIEHPNYPGLRSSF